MSHSKQLESAVPPSKISCLSSGEFVGMVADDPDNKIELKTVHCQILNDHLALKTEQSTYKELPVLRKLDRAVIQKSYLQIKMEVEEIISSEMESMLNNPVSRNLVVKKHS